MADLSPDLSSYHQGFGAMNPGQLLGLIQQGRQLQTQSGIADAIRANPNDPTAAYGAAAKNPNVFMGPEDVSSFVHAQRAKSELGQWQMGQATSAISSLLTKDNATTNDWQPIRLMLARYGVPNDMLDMVEKSAAPNGKLNRDSLVNIQQWTQGNAGLPTVPTVNPETQQPENVPAGTLMHRQAQQPGSVGGSGAVGAYPTGAPPFQASTQKAASDAQQSIRDAAYSAVPQQRQLLSNMSDLSREAATGPGANWQVNWSKLMTNMGMPQFASMTPDQVSSSENFKKIAERLVNQMATSGGHITNDFLHNAYGSNPGLEISRQGREGMITWLQGITDAQSLIAKNWEDWIQRPENTGKEGHFYDWASGKVPGGMDMKNFDMRVFQFERMGQDQQDKFLASMTGKGEREKFLTHHQNYYLNGWLDSAKQ